jgi:hypothetical protein
MPARRFPPPWSAEVTPNCFIVRDANGQALRQCLSLNFTGLLTGFSRDMLILDLLLLMRRVEKRVYDSHRLRDHLLSLRLILRIGKFRAIEKRPRFSNAHFETGLE